jgi:hypothetical protein
MVLAVNARELDPLPKSYKYCGDIDIGVERLVRWIEEAVTHHISFLKASFIFCYLVVE